MGRMISIITVGLSPAWDITCRGRNLEWGGHQHIEEQAIDPAGKALNVSRALAWMGQENIAAGLWGRSDFRQMLAAVRNSWPLIEVEMTAAAGSTRRNVTVVDKANGREMHLRSKSLLVSAKALKKLQADLETTVHEGSVCVFAGTMPESGLLDDVVQVIESCRSRGAKIVLDTSGDALRQIVDTGAAWLIKPNVEELRELLGEQVKDGSVSLASAGGKLLDKVGVVLISRGAKGSVVVTQQGAWQGRCLGRARVLATVGCGDFLLAGFLKGLKDKSDARSALNTAIKVATAKAWGWTEGKTWSQARREIQVAVERV
ncbi:MAG: 1-phosphofructokinase family hexose kinase [Planctomycetota bacterium]|jgi:1-phosphofructokinase family hexose kinase